MFEADFRIKIQESQIDTKLMNYWFLIQIRLILESINSLNRTKAHSCELDWTPTGEEFGSNTFDEFLLVQISAQFCAKTFTTALLSI